MKAGELRIDVTRLRADLEALAAIDEPAAGFGARVDPAANVVGADSRRTGRRW